MRAFDQVVGWLEHFEALEEPRQAGKAWYPFDEVLLLCLVAVLAAAESWVEIAEFGKKKLELLRRFRPFENGTPSHDQLGDLFAALDAEEFQRRFIAWVGSLSAWSSRQRLVFGLLRPFSNFARVGSDASHAIRLLEGVVRNLTLDQVLSPMMRMLVCLLTNE